MKKRLQELVSLLPPCQLLADVGCDHGYLGAYALSTGKAKRVLFCDISSPSLQKAEQLCQSSELSGAEFFCGFGLPQLADIDVAVIAGMGGHEIIDIINKASFLPRCLVLQPMKHASEVRLALSDRYTFVKDYIIAEGKRFYTVMLLTTGSDAFSPLELAIGKTSQAHSPDLCAYIRKEKAKYRSILTKTQSPEAARALALLEQVV